MKKVITTEFKQETALLVLKHGYSYSKAANAMGVCTASIGRWVKQYKDEINGVTPKAKAITAEQQKIQKLEKEIKQLKLEKEILKKATALFVSGDINNIK